MWLVTFLRRGAENTQENKACLKIDTEVIEDAIAYAKASGKYPAADWVVISCITTFQAEEDIQF